MGGLSLMSVTVMMAVAVLERPKFRFPSMSVACTMMVYWETFWGRLQTHSSIVNCWFVCVISRKNASREEKKKKAV